MGRCKSLGSLKVTLSYASQLSGVSIQVFFTSWAPLGLRAGIACSLMAAGSQVFFSILSALRAHQLTLDCWNPWRLWHACLLIDTAGNIPFLKSQNGVDMEPGQHSVGISSASRMPLSEVTGCYLVAGMPVWKVWDGFSYVSGILTRWLHKTQPKWTYWVFSFGVSPWSCLGLPQWLSGKRICLQCKNLRRHRFNPWVGKIP